MAHWQELPLHTTHVWVRGGELDGHCKGCMMHRDWPGAREECTYKAKRPPKQARPLPLPPRQARPLTADDERPYTRQAVAGGSRDR
jgi:hypothetical protein